ncbi:hypothetical protein ACNKHU_16855 [Shigella flexneri]
MVQHAQLFAIAASQVRMGQMLFDLILMDIQMPDMEGTFRPANSSTTPHQQRMPVIAHGAAMAGREAAWRRDQRLSGETH